MDLSLQPKVRRLLQSHESTVLHLYADSKGLPTIGTGHYLHDVKDFLALPLVNKAYGTTASPTLAYGDWGASIAPNPNPFAAHHYESLMNCRLPPEAAAELLDRDIDAAIAQLQAHGFQVDSWPDDATLATLDWVFNAGIGSLLNTVHFKAALLAKDFASAAANCHRAGVREDRNDTCRDLYLSAAKGATT